MTGGRVVVIGPTGRNFAAGMSGGIAYVYDDNGQFAKLCNTEMVELEKPDKPEDNETIKRLLENHLQVHRLARRQGDSGRLRKGTALVREGDADRLPPRAGASGGDRRTRQAAGRTADGNGLRLNHGDAETQRSWIEFCLTLRTQ